MKETPTKHQRQFFSDSYHIPLSIRIIELHSKTYGFERREGNVEPEVNLKCENPLIDQFSSQNAINMVTNGDSPYDGASFHFWSNRLMASFWRTIRINCQPICVPLLVQVVTRRVLIWFADLHGDGTLWPSPMRHLLSGWDHGLAGCTRLQGFKHSHNSIDFEAVHFAY